MIKMLLLAGRDRNRLGEILHVASRFGLGVILQRLGIERSADVRDDGPDADAMPLPRRTRLALEELGPTFVKLGQILATRGDLLPEDWITELEQLHSRAPTVAFEHLRPAVEDALGQPPETAFARFDPAPLAAASMAQVHRATLTDGREVVLKIRRPGIRPRMEADLRLIAQLAAIVEKASAEARRFAPTAMMRQLAEAISEELDFTTEGRNADRLRADFAHEARVVVPDIHWAWTSETLLVMDYIDGVPPRDREELRASGIDPAAIAALGADMVLDMVLMNGRFHGDPHPGNLLCVAGNRIALLDLGMIGHVSPRRREEFISFVQALNAGDPAQLADVLATWSAGSGTSREQIQAAAERLIVRHGGGRLVLSAMVADFFPLLREEGMTMPADLLLIFKALVTVDGVLSRIEPDFDLSAAMQRSSVRILAARLAPDYWTPTLQALAWELGKIGDDAPRLLRAAIRRLEDARPTRSPNNGQADAILTSGHRIAAAIIAGSLLIAGARFLA
ncbi:AarF/ABC1/UbiB kinase family protein (plasmid) [Sphingobium fuliginis]|jgi:ubiquinone biosynthesis protein|uniref:AarF/ABC1/UbiB kinase family protein n=1 Tax=Sphingobium fuliginis (strain ATCC 27551) TaxID=336203 RepID=A0A7M2GPX1_SPHSA|nr:AarF/UbiB family protein [Sphingobium fuliginis]QOT74568.1 AarF/ABC1/UbiB kinase family protein [Sphingobium fuliginis]